MVFIHGGAFIHDSSDPGKYGPELLVSQDVVLVTLNYRLGALGWLTTNTRAVPGNLGLRDMLAGLEWVQQHIAGFGGDPGRVTVFGESAGSMAVSALITLPWPAGVAF